MSEKKKIALVTTWFPPKSGVAVNRMESFAEFLAEDFEVVVFALDDKPHSAVHGKQIQVHYASGSRIDRLLKSDTRDSLPKHKLKTLLRIIRSRVQKDPLAGWMRSTVEKLISEHAKKSFDLVISSYAPAEAHEAILEFKKNYPDLPWIADMRDEMSLNPHNLPHLNEKLRKLEQRINGAASALTTVSLPILEDYRKLCPDIPHFLEVRNGYNHELQFPEHQPGNVMKIGHFGSFYGKRKPGLFFDALLEVLKDEPEVKVELHFVGAHRNFEIPEKLNETVFIREPLAYLDAINEMAVMDANLMIEPRSERKGVFTGKLFDYLSVRRPVLALVDTSDVAAQLIRETNAGYTGECTSREENIAAIRAAIHDWKNRSMRTISATEAVKLHRRIQVGKLKELINEIIQE